jgi:formylglycine-generating enzyme required for sulfatase activity
MNQLVGRVQTLGGQRHAGEVAENMFRRDTDGGRIVGLALAAKNPQRQHVDLALSGIANSRSAFEQYHALQLAQKLLPSLHPSAAAQLRQAIDLQIGKTILGSDPSRWMLARKLLEDLQTIVGLERRLETPEEAYNLRGYEEILVEVTTPTTLIRYADGDESHGNWVKTRGIHSLQLPSTIHMGKYLVTNSLYLRFVEENGYRNDDFWSASRDARRRFLTQDGVSLGPGNWPNSRTLPAGKEEHPVVSICYSEAQAFVNWCNSITGSSERQWTLPLEDEWEFVARTEAGFVYPWGDSFDPERCNSSESGIGDTSEVTRFRSGASKAGCCDMAGNVWEFVLAADATPTLSVLRGGSFNNDRFVVRSYLRLFGVPLAHRPGDFGFRLAQRPADDAEFRRPASVT